MNGNFNAATAPFDGTVRKVLPPDAPAGARDIYHDEFGRHQPHGDPNDAAFGACTVPLRMEDRLGEFRVTFHKDGSIAGLLFLGTGGPISVVSSARGLFR